MDTQKIGNLLAELRRENHLTQEQLGEKLGVSNKTISRWETGNYMPPVDALFALSGLYQISINEILSGQRLKDEDYKANAEENMTAVLEDMENSRKAAMKHWKRVFYGFLIGSTVTTLLIITIVSQTLLFSTDGPRLAGVAVLLLSLLMMVATNTLTFCLYVSQTDKL